MALFLMSIGTMPAVAQSLPINISKVGECILNIFCCNHFTKALEFLFEAITFCCPEI